MNEYSWICSPTFDSTISHTTGNALSTFTPSLGVTPFTKPYRDVLCAHGFHCFRSSSLHVSFISRVMLVLPTSLYYSLNLNCTPLNVWWPRFTRKHAGIPSMQSRPQCACLTQSVQHVIVDCVIRKAPDGFAGPCRLDAATRTWLKELTLIFERLANDYITLVFNCHLEIQVQEHCKH